MSEFGYDLAGESVTLFLKHENRVYSGLDKKNKKVDALVNRMEELEHFLNFVTNKTDASNRMDLVTAEDQAIVDKMRAHEDLQHIFPHGKYSWKDKEIDNMTRMIENHMQGPLQRKITMLSEQLVLDQHDLNKSLEMFKSGLTRMTNQIERILANMQRGR